MSNWSTPSKVLQTIRAGDEIQQVRSLNRSKVLAAANGMPPFDEETKKKLGIDVNVNWNELLELLCEARGQLLSAFLSNQYFFTVKIPLAPPEHQSEWESFITNEINRILRDSLEYFELHRSRWSSVITHGIGPMMWNDRHKWLARFKPLSDLRIATDTVVDFHNMDWFASREPYTFLELIDEVFNDKPNNHWDKDSVAKILRSYKETNFTDATNNYDFETDSEKFQELVKQNGGYWGSDAIPTIPMFRFYFKNNDKWFMRVVPENGVKGVASEDKFLWQSDEPVANSWQEILHCQYGDLSIDAPFKFHSVRGLGFVELEPTFYKNMTRCRLVQHVHDNFNIWLKSTDNAEKARAQIQVFKNLGVLKQGLSVVPQTERHQVAAQLVEMVFAQLQQVQSGGASAYTQQSDTGTNKEQTAFETRVKMEQVNAKMGSILLTAFKYESYAYREICRRFCIRNSSDPDVARFYTRCLTAGIPRQFLDVKLWDVDPVTPLGMGNPTIAQAAQQQLMQLRPMMNPTAQNEVLHESILVITKDPRKAARWAPMSGAPTESDAKREMVGYFAALKSGAVVPLSQANLIDQCEALLPLYGGWIQQMTKRDNMASHDEAAGLESVSHYIGLAIQQLSQDKTQAVKVKEFQTIKAQQDNLARALIQRGEQARQKQAKQNGNGEAAAMALKLKGEQMSTAQRLQAEKMKTAQTLRHRELEFRQKQAHDHVENQLGEQRKDIDLAADVGRSHYKALADAHNKRLTDTSSKQE